ncbi:DUF6777 domain-containing protein [Streptomyces sp. NPDC000983]|uniref:DUF6777 domain-containing protein n=1 Tax=Streptomyces sp. NPDC000983 TaxID=3154373 RepID=UPI00332CA12A
MSVEPPSSGRPTGPPSGPLSGPSQPPSGPPSQPPSQPPPPPTGTGGGGGAPEPEPHRAWWRSAPRIAVLTTVVVAAVVLALVFSRGDGGGGSGGEVFLQAAGESGPDPFTESAATDSSAPPVTPSPATPTATGNTVRGVDGGAPGLYGGTRNTASCDVEKQIKALQGEPEKNDAFASVADVEPAGVPAYLRDLTPVQLRLDTRVTNHGYQDGRATPYQAVLQTGTAVLVDDRGVPRVRCACGNPLTPPVAQQSTPRTTGDSWPSYNPSNVVVVAPSTTVVNVFVVYDDEHDDWFRRESGDTGHKDKKTDPPAHRPSVSPSTPPSKSPSTGTTITCPGTPTATPTGDPPNCPPTSTAPSEPTTPPTSESPSEPSSEPPSVPESADTSSAEAPASESLPASGSPLSPASSPEV